MSDLTEVLGVILVSAGSLFVLVAAVGLIRFPDALSRMHATTKAGTLGLGLIAVSNMLFFAEMNVVARSAGIILFIFLTAPISAHMISRAAYFADVKLWEGTFVDQLREDRHREEITRAESSSEVEDHR